MLAWLLLPTRLAAKDRGDLHGGVFLPIGISFGYWWWFMFCWLLLPCGLLVGHAAPVHCRILLHGWLCPRHWHGAVFDWLLLPRGFFVSVRQWHLPGGVLLSIGHSGSNPISVSTWCILRARPRRAAPAALLAWLLLHTRAVHADRQWHVRSRLVLPCRLVVWAGGRTLSRALRV